MNNHVKSGVTQSAAGMTENWKRAYKNETVLTFDLKPGSEYGPLFYHGTEDYAPRVAPPDAGEDQEIKCWLGFEKAANRDQANEMYNLKNNAPEYVHTIMIKIPIDCGDAQLYVGPVAGGTGFQANYNASSVKHWKCIKLEKLLSFG